MFHGLLSLGGREWKLESVLYSALYTGSTPPVFKEGESDCEEEVYISNINNNNKKPTARKMGNDKGKSAPLTSLSFTETQTPLSWTEQGHASMPCNVMKLNARISSCYLLWAIRHALSQESISVSYWLKSQNSYSKKHTPHLCLQYNTTAREEAKSHNNVCCNFSKVFSHGVSLFDFICVNSVQCLQSDRDLSATKPRSSNSAQ